MLHFSFDFAQQIHFPNSPQQVGPLYFLTPRKCQLFSVCCEAKSEQVNYLINENDNPGKGANCVVSLVHHYSEMHTSHNQEICLHADNAVGQNKNNTMMQYLCWRIITGKSLKITLSFMMAGHMKFAPDRFFGLQKKSYRRTSVSSMKDIEGMVCNSTVSGKNIRLITLDFGGKRNVVWYNWSEFLSKHFSMIPGISQYHQFRFDSHSPGVVFVKVHSKAQEAAVTIGRGSCGGSSGMPQVVIPTGMTVDWQIYLYEKIRPFCSSDAADLTCPMPSTYAPSHPAEKSVRSQRKCSHCRQSGHTKTVRGVITCPQLFNE